MAARRSRRPRSSVECDPARPAPRLLPRLGAFLFAFGTWDFAYYIALYALLRWPPCVTTLDLLFLVLPGPWWIQPVWVPVAISCVMIAAGARFFTVPERRREG